MTNVYKVQAHAQEKEYRLFFGQFTGGHISQHPLCCFFWQKSLMVCMNTCSLEFMITAILRVCHYHTACYIRVVQMSKIKKKELGHFFMF